MDNNKFCFVDPIHGKVEYPGYVKQLICTEEFQRLRNLKQLGSSSRVFFGATHTRFEHCLGVCYLSLKLMKTLEQNSGVTISDIHRKCVAIAGLFHDLGHGPFSHMWEDYVHAVNPSEEWSHEQTSGDLVKHFFAKYDHIRLSEERLEHLYGIELIQNLIIGDLDHLKTLLTPDLMYLTEIVANKATSIDVDKQDYILRDAYYLRGNIRILDFAGFFDRCRITKDLNDVAHISYHIDDYQLLSNMFENRASLHIFCYQEPQVRGIEQMLIDVLMLAEEAGFTIKGMKPSELHKDLEKWLLLTDSVTMLIQASDDPKMHEAQKLLKRLNAGDFYKLVWMSPTPLNVTAIAEKFGPHFFQVQKRIPLSSVFMTKNIIFHDDDGQRVAPPVEKLPKRCAYYEEYLIFAKDTQEADEVNGLSESVNNLSLNSNSKE
ncbi:deoxynucleoside triphosphate triphosphohydrolase SAMHD1 [Culicoides brevitarsis]|uniref:deoxynucleoside triphosphate triphosphohydrolase SAMHD1 n=1 Tax=Culicoides brevitarsis TaxID=469753 RepID=UPI00307B9BEE